MPEGVEHLLVAHVPSSIIWVFIPLMPEGVEHNNMPLSAFMDYQPVFIPLMPEGVEHRTGQN